MTLAQKQCGVGRLGLSLLLLMLFVVPFAHAAPKVASSSEASSSAQVDGIIDAAVDKLWAQNDEYWHQGDYPRIIALDRIITQADPHFIDCYNTGAWLMWSSGLDSDAQAFYEQAVANNPHVSAAYYDYGMFLLNHRKDFAGAIRVYGQDTQHADAGILDWRMLAHSYEKAGDWKRAVQTWRQIKTRWPHGVAHDSTSAAVDDNNLQRALAHLNGTSGTNAPEAAGKTPPAP